MIGALGTAAYCAAPYVVPAVAALAGRAVSNYIGAKGPAMVWDQSYASTQNTSAAYLGRLSVITAPVAAFWAGEVASQSTPAVGLAAQVAGLAVPYGINAVGSYFSKPAEQKVPGVVQAAFQREAPRGDALIREAASQLA